MAETVPPQERANARDSQAVAAPRDLEPLFAPQSIAVIGASSRAGTAGNEILKNLIAAPFAGVVYPVNPKSKSIMGIRCAPGISGMSTTPGPAPLRYTSWVKPPPVNGAGVHPVRSASGAVICGCPFGWC